jgi:ketosteroid isomerase-like protein
MKYKIQFILPVFLLFFSCNNETEKALTDKWKQEILETEHNFAEMAKEKGITKAFLSYAAEDAVLMRNNTLVIGKENLIDYFDNQTSDNNEVSLTWKPDFVDVSLSGDLGYTYGNFTFSYTDSSGSVIENSGVFHTVWKRQTDDSWKFVWD